MSVRPDHPALFLAFEKVQNATITRSYPSRRSGTCGRAGLSPVLSCTTWGLSCLLPCGWSGELLPRLFTLARQSLSPAWWYVFCDTFRCPGLRQRPPRFHAARCSAVSGLSSRPQPTEACPTSDHSGRPMGTLGHVRQPRKTKTLPPCELRENVRATR